MNTKRKLNLTLSFVILSLISFLLLIAGCSTANRVNEYSLHHNYVQTMGRVVKESDVLHLGYPGVSVQFTARAKKVELSAHSSQNDIQLDLFIDGEFSKTLTVGNQPELISLMDVPDATERRFTLINRAESWHGVAALTSLTVTNGLLLATAPLPNRKLLVIGDSVSCGAVVDRGAHCQKSPTLTNPYQSYGMKTARNLDSQVHLVCFSGRGLIRSWDGNMEQQQAPDYINYAIPTWRNSAMWDHQQYQPDAIVIALGTNDFNPGIPTHAEYVTPYVEFVKSLQSQYEDTQIVLTAGAMVNDFNANEPKRTTLHQYLSEVADITSTKDSVVVAPSSYQAGDDCDPHPTAPQHTIMADELTAFIKPILEW